MKSSNRFNYLPLDAIQMRLFGCSDGTRYITATSRSGFRVSFCLSIFTDLLVCISSRRLKLLPFGSDYSVARMAPDTSPQLVDQAFEYPLALRTLSSVLLVPVFNTSVLLWSEQSCKFDQHILYTSILSPRLHVAPFGRSRFRVLDLLIHEILLILSHCHTSKWFRVSAWIFL
jgi:hypothetical protein